MTVHDPKLLPPAPPQPALPPAHSTPPQKAPVTTIPPPSKNPVVSIIIWIVVLGGIAALGYFGWHYYEGAQKSGPAGKGGKGHNTGPMPVIVENAKVGDMPLYINRVGTVNAFNTVTLRSRIDGQLEKVAFTEGQLVHEGDLLFQIDARPYQVQLEQAQGQLAKDEATLNNAKVDLGRYQAAAEAISQQQLATAEATVKSAEGTLKADQGAIDSAKLNITYCRILAPISGRIGLRMVDQGNMIHASDVNGLAVITQLQPISVIFSPTEDDLPQVQEAMAGKDPVVVEAWDRSDSKKIATGKIAALENQIDPTTGTFKIKSIFSNEDNALYPNQFVNVHLLVKTLPHVLLVPDAAIQQSPTSAFVYVVDKDNKVEMRNVVTGAMKDGLTVITPVTPGEVADGDPVVTAGVDKLEPGVKVDPHSPAEAATQNATASAPASRGAHTRPGGAAGKSRKGS